MFTLALGAGCSSEPPMAASELPLMEDGGVSGDGQGVAEVGDSLCDGDQACALSMGALSDCLQARCDLFSGQCVSHQRPNGLSCDDQDACTTNDVCDEGTCAGGVPILCDDQNPCTLDTCLPESGCASEPRQGECDDGDPCTLADSCQEGHCVSTLAADCDDSNPCTSDTCIPGLGCGHDATIGEPCDDQNACTPASECAASGVCVGLKSLVCDDENTCTSDTCEPDSGCVFTPNLFPCDDGDACTDEDTCSQGACVGTASECDDKDPCTVDQCVEEVGCTHTAFQGPCDDDNACTTDDQCLENGACQGAPLSCEDGNPCTYTTCDTLSGCSSTNLAGSGCEDGDLCTVFDECSEDGLCLPGAPPTCDDGNACTTDSCEPSVGCVFTPVQMPCDDGNPCTESDHCEQGYCVGAQTDCDDLNSCTKDGCSTVSGCTYSPQPGACDDGSSCTQGEACQEGECVGVAVDCSDGNSCTTDSCDPSLGCANEVLPDLTACDDGDPCTVDETCMGGTCELSGETLECVDGDDCTADQCLPLLGCAFPTKPECLPPTAWPVINEVDYGQFGNDTSDFVELLLVGEGTANLGLYTLEFIDGDTGGLYDLIHLSQVGPSAAPGVRIVVGPPSIANGGDGSSLGVVVPGDFLQNGSDTGDAIRVVRNGDELIDSVSYEAAVEGATEGDHHIGFDSELNDVPLSLGRCGDGQDADNNSTDFQGMAPSPGLPNLCVDDSVPTYWDDIAPIFMTRCGSCHAGSEPSECSGSACFASHYEVNQWMSEVCTNPQLPIGACNLVRVLDGTMPNNLGGMIPVSEVALIESWIDSGMLQGIQSDDPEF